MLLNRLRRFLDFGIRSNSRRRHAVRPARSRRWTRPLGFERLEDRLVPTTFPVSNLLDSGAGSLRQAILDANSAGGSNLISFANGVSGAIDLASALPDLQNTLDIEGPGAKTLTVQRSHAAGTPEFRIFSVPIGATVTIAGLAIANGVADDGGGIDNLGTLTVDHVWIHDNTATFIGGGIANGKTQPSLDGNLTVLNSTISNNTNADGGNGAAAIDMEGNGTMTIDNSTISQNTSINSDTTGGIGVYGGTATISHSTITGNTASGEGGGGADSQSPGQISVFDTIIAGNSGGNGGDIAFDFISLGHNLIGNNSSNSTHSQPSGFVDGQNGDQVGTGSAPINAKLGPVADNGGPTPTNALVPGSPAIDQGDNANAPATDQRGLARIVNNIIDIGAFEFAPTPAATQLVLTGLPSSLTAGVSQTFTVTAEDASNHVVSTYTGTVQFTSTDSTGTIKLTSGGNALPFPASYTFTPADQGTHQFTVTYTKTGKPTLAVTDQANNALTASASPTVNPAAVKSFDIAGMPAQVAAGDNVPVTITARDAFNNVATNYTGPVHFASTDPLGTVPPDQTFPAGSNGVLTITSGITFQTAGGQSIIVNDVANPSATGVASTLVTSTTNPGGNPGGNPGAGPSSPLGGVASTAPINQKVVGSLYARMLNRDVEPGGLTLWSGLLDHGASRLFIAQSIAQSPEYLTIQVQMLYQRLLNRPADKAGLDGYLHTLLTGGTEREVEASILASPEYFQTHGNSVPGFLSAVYLDALGRPIEAAALATFGSQVGISITRQQFVNNLLSTLEGRQFYVQGLYQALLNRAADAKGLNAWATMLAQPDSDLIVIAGIAASDEAFAGI